MGYTIKTGVVLVMTDEIQKILSVIGPHYDAYHVPLVITSGMEGAHGARSLHPHNLAIDVRSNFDNPFEREAWRMHCAAILEGIDLVIKKMKLPIQIVHEKDHVHYEWDERGKA